ncbi:MAG TPA: hypothetical protein VMF59_05180 [Bacteroidota bacterium]|nr:hypothetical protein [Bacteroidota bacterium]
MQLAVWGEPSDINMPSGNPPAASPFELDNPYPNPMDAGTTLEFTLPRQSTVSMWVVRARGVASDNTGYFNVGGGSMYSFPTVVRKLASGKALPAGRFAVNWDSRDENGSDVPTGFYRVYFQAGDFAAFHDILLARSPYDLPPGLRNPGIH